ncbi:unnamed protein product, partial [Iphiclides podalirius]
MRMQPAFQTSVLNAISWDNLPLLTMELTAKRNAMNAVHHSLLAEANYFKFTLVGCYNLPNINHGFTVYTAASKTTMFNETKMSIIKFDEGYRDPKHFTDTSFYPKWESLRLDDSINSQNPVKLDYGLNSIQNDNGIFLEKYLTESSKCTFFFHFYRLLSKGCIILKKDPEAAEQFFLALLFFHPFWLVGLIAANAFFLKREYFEIADKIMEWVKRTKAEGSSELLNIARAWEHELGDWWESTPLLPGTSLYYDAADLLLRIRAINLAEVCIAQAFTKYGGCPVYYHLLALCCRLRGDIDNALCHIQEGIKKFGEKSFLRALEAECYHVQKNNSASVASFEKVGANCGSYCTLLSILSGGSERSRLLLAELLRRQPSAYSWLAFADEWLALAKEERKKTRSLDYESSAVKYAIACATEALKIDKKAGRAWALLAKLVTPTARKVYCARMAVAVKTPIFLNPYFEDM